MRQGELSADAIRSFAALSRTLPTSDITPTELFPLRREVDRSNTARLLALGTNSTVFEARDSGDVTEQRTKLLAVMMAVERLELKIGAQVMLIKNTDERLVNGSVGKVIGFHFSREVCGFKTKSGLVRNVLTEKDGVTPVRPAKDENDPELANSEKKPQMYTKPGSKTCKANEALPLVRFPTPNGSETVLLAREEFRVEDNEGKLLARRVQVGGFDFTARMSLHFFIQIPLVLAWAMSIHKSQGQTIQRLKIDLGKVFEKGVPAVKLRCLNLKLITL